ncbi:hypothetical protein [Lewinella sp. LCG006]|uniref:hypothetical protein n=1 Tax=Lewinella sp. LCG006 TaxID=3231911 RepID=UPI00345F3375
MKHLIYSLLIAISFGWTFELSAQNERPAYCDQLPVTYSKGGAANSRPSLPKFSTTPTLEYKVQVAILRNTDPREYPFHEDLIARYRPCEEVWVIESRESFTSRSQAIQLQNKLRNLGYNGAYLIEMVGYK